MTDIEIINKLLASKKSSDIFTGSEWKKAYITYSKMIHPDFCKHPKSGEAMSIMNIYKDIIENGVEYEDEAGKFRVFDDKIVYPINAANKSLITASFSNYRILKQKTDAASINFQKYMPLSMDITADKLTINLLNRAVPLTNQKLPQEHVNWIFSRLFELSMYIQDQGYAHLGFNPTSIFVVPVNHGIICTTFYHMAKLNNKAKTVSAKYKMWYPASLFTNKIATGDIDLELAKKIALYLLGDKSAAGMKLKTDKSVNKDILNFFIIKHDCSVDLYQKYRDLLKKHFPPKFFDLDL